MKVNRIFILANAVSILALCAAGTGTWLFRRSTLRLAAENGELRAELDGVRAAREASVAAHKASLAEKDRAVADLEARLLRNVDELAAMKAAMSTNASDAAKSCEMLRERLRRAEAERAALSKSLEGERRRVKTLEDREKAYSSVRSEADRRELDELIRLTDGASRKPAEPRR